MKKTRVHRWTKKSKVLLGTGLLLVTVLLSSLVVYAALSATDSRQNDFKVSDFKVTLEETFEKPDKLEKDKPIKKIISVKNEGEQASFIRVLLLASFELTDGTGNKFLMPAKVTGESPNLAFKLNIREWLLGEDGYYYYLKKLEKGKKTSDLLKSVTILSEGLEYDDMELKIEAKVEGINCTKWAYRDAWWQGTIPAEEVESLYEVETTLSSLTEK